MTHREDLERRIRERGVRVEERLDLLRLALADGGSEPAGELVARRRKLLEAVRDAAAEVRKAVG